MTGEGVTDPADVWEGNLSRQAPYILPHFTRLVAAPPEIHPPERVKQGLEVLGVVEGLKG